MILTNDYATETLNSPVKAGFISLLIGEGGIELSNIIYDPGDGWKPFIPFEVTCNGVLLDLPTFLDQGRYLLHLAGEKFNGTALMLVGQNMWAVENIEIIELIDSNSACSVRRGRSAITPEGVFIEISPPLKTDTYAIIKVWCTDARGIETSVKFPERYKNRFKAASFKNNADLEWVAIE